MPANSWQRFLKKHKGLGLSMTELSLLYRKKRSQKGGVRTEFTVCSCLNSTTYCRDGTQCNCRDNYAMCDD